MYLEGRGNDKRYLFFRDGLFDRCNGGRVCDVDYIGATMKRLWFALAALLAAVGLWQVARIFVDTGIRYAINDKWKGK